MMYLEGLKVLDLSRVLAGPLATQSLADMGAEVLKIEPPGGDDTRRWGPPFQNGMSAYFQSCNRNKASLRLDLKDPSARAHLDRLIAVADVVVDNYTPSVRTRLGLDDARLARLNPRAVILTITGYRATREDDPGYDLIIQAEAGFMAVTGPEQGSPYKVGVPVVDVLTGMMAVHGVLAALYRRERCGQGAVLSISLFQTALLSLVNVACQFLVNGEPTRRWGNQHPNIVPYCDFQLADRVVIIGVGNDTQFRRLCALLGLDREPLAEMDNARRVASRTEVLRALSERLATVRSEDLLPQLKRARIPAAPILRPDEALRQVATWDPGAILALDHETIGTVKLPANPLTGDGMRRSHRPPPLPDEGGGTMAARWLS